MKTWLNIAIDVAHAMEYLHHDSPMQIVHCDIKLSNVLLDEYMLSQLTDFGIARLVGATSNESLISTLSLRGYMGYISQGMDFQNNSLTCLFVNNIFYGLVK